VFFTQMLISQILQHLLKSNVTNATSRRASLTRKQYLDPVAQRWFVLYQLILDLCIP
jgi:hypothetical protein